MSCWWNHKLARQWKNRAFQSHQQGNERITAGLQFGGVPIKQRLEHKLCFVVEARQGSEDLSATCTFTVAAGLFRCSKRTIAPLLRQNSAAVAAPRTGVRSLHRVGRSWPARGPIRSVHKPSAGPG